MNRKIRRIINEVFGDTTINEPQTGDKGFSFNSDIGSQADTDQADIGQPDKLAMWLLADDQNEHTLALRRLLELEEAGKLETPPLPATWDLEHLRLARPVVHHWYSETGRLILNFTQEFLETLIHSPNPQPTYVKSERSSHFFETTIGDESSGVKAKIQAKHDKSDNNHFALTVAVEVPGREWPRLAKIPVSLTLAEHHETQLTNAFGTTLFSRLAVIDLPSLRIAVGPVPDRA